MARGLQLLRLDAPLAPFDASDDDANCFVLTVLPSCLSDLVGAVRGPPPARGACESKVSSRLAPPAALASSSLQNKDGPSAIDSGSREVLAAFPFVPLVYDTWAGWAPSSNPCMEMEMHGTKGLGKDGHMPALYIGVCICGS